MIILWRFENFINIFRPTFNTFSERLFMEVSDDGCKQLIIGPISLEGGGNVQHWWLQSVFLVTPRWKSAIKGLYPHSMNMCHLHVPAESGRTLRLLSFGSNAISGPRGGVDKWVEKKEKRSSMKEWAYVRRPLGPRRQIGASPFVLRQLSGRPLSRG